MYPTREQFTCVRCKEKVFTSWNDFENHHAKVILNNNVAKNEQHQFTNFIVACC